MSKSAQESARNKAQKQFAAAEHRTLTFKAEMDRENAARTTPPPLRLWKRQMPLPPRGQGNRVRA